MAAHTPRRVTVTESDLLAELQKSLGPRGRPAGDGWYAIDELAAQLRISEPRLQRKIDKWVEAGTAEEAEGTRRDPHGVERNLRFYRLKGAK